MEKKIEVTLGFSTPLVDEFEDGGWMSLRLESTVNVKTMSTTEAKSFTQNILCDQNDNSCDI